MKSETENQNGIEDVIAESRKYKYGFVTDIETETIPKGLSEDVVREISKRKGEPDFVLDFRLKAYRRFTEMKEPKWANLEIPSIDFNDIS